MMRDDVLVMRWLLQTVRRLFRWRATHGLALGVQHRWSSEPRKEPW